MIFHFVCPRCHQEHAILDKGVFLSLTTERSVSFECPFTHETLLLYFTLKIELQKEYSPEDLRAAEEQASLTNHQWEMEEGSLDNKNTGK